MSGQDEKFSKKNKEKKFQVKLTLTQKQINRYEEYRMKNKLKGSLQEAIQLAADREVTGANLIGEDKDLIDKISFLKTIAAVSELLHDIALSDDKRNSHRNIAAIVQSGKLIINYENKHHRLYNELDFLPGEIGYYEGHKVFG